MDAKRWSRRHRQDGADGQVVDGVSTGEWRVDSERLVRRQWAKEGSWMAV